MTIKNTLKIITFFFISLMLVACGSGKHSSPPQPSPPSPSPPPPPPPPKVTVLEGTWKYNCVASKVIPKWSNKIINSYKDHEVTFTKISYVGTHCTSPQVTAKLTSDIVLGDTVDRGSDDQHTNINTTANHIEVTINDDATLKLVNLKIFKKLGIGKFGGLTDWKLNVPKDLSNNKMAIKYYRVGKTNLDIFKIDTNTLKMGDKTGDLDTDGRPITLDKNKDNWGTRK